MINISRILTDRDAEGMPEILCLRIMKIPRAETLCIPNTLSMNSVHIDEAKLILSKMIDLWNNIMKNVIIKDRQCVR